MKYTEEYGKLGMPDDFKFGIELEADNVNTLNSHKRGKFYKENLK